MRDWRTNPSEADIARLRAAYPVETTVDATLTQKLRNRSRPARGAMVDDGELGRRLAAFIGAQVAEPFQISALRPLAGGSSKPQYFFEIARQGRRPEQLVLRLETGESIVQTHRLREFQILGALQGQLPVPAPYWIDVDGTWLGCPGFVYGFCEGVSRPPRDGQISGPQQGYGEHYRKLLAPQFVDRLADLALAGWDENALTAFDIPAPGTTEAALQAINWWQRVWEEDRIKPVPLMTATANWLRQNAPVADRISILHGDYRSGNFLFDLESGDITALLDWELVRFGDRHEDLAYGLNRLYSTRSPEGVELCGGFLLREEYLARYEARCGLKIDPLRLDYYEVFTYWKSVVITQASSARCVLGRKTHQDILVGMSYMIAPTLFQLLCDAMRGKY